MIIEDAVIRLPSLFKPNEVVVIEGQSYKGCVIAGPANVLVVGDFKTEVSIHWDRCDFVVLGTGPKQVNTAIVIKDCTFSSCRFERVCFLVLPGAAPALAQACPETNWLTDPPEIPAIVPAQPVEGMTKQ